MSSIWAEDKAAAGKDDKMWTIPANAEGSIKGEVLYQNFPFLLCFYPNTHNSKLFYFFFLSTLLSCLLVLPKVVVLPLSEAVVPLFAAGLLFGAVLRPAEAQRADLTFLVSRGWQFFNLVGTRRIIYSHRPL